MAEERKSNSWHPKIGDNFKKMLSKNKDLSDEEKNILTNQTKAILSNCVPPGESRKSTGLVIGYVQSGKTLSFTSLSAMARDNRFQLVIILAGTKTNLVEQSYNRLVKDLSIEEAREWNIYTTSDQQFQQSQMQRVEATFDKWRRAKVKSAPSVMIVAMKHHSHLDSLAELMGHCNLERISVLIIDDEGDQAGLNTKVSDYDESTTYSKIRKLRDAFPEHSYVLYTATPQAPLLISRIDFLSPDFGKVITPGSAYVGGKEFFASNSPYIKQIPYSEIPDKDDAPNNPPPSLLDALGCFFIGVAVGILTGEHESRKNRSMMIHPAVTKESHLMFSRWVYGIKKDWQEILQRNRRDLEYQQLIGKFRKQYDDIKYTDATHYSFAEIEDFLIDAVSDTSVQELNTRETNKISPVNWQHTYSWILIGGLGLDRGFTIEGLTVSYMLRNIGVGNVDNIQQRARFFGYKKPYLGFCRIFLSGDNIDAFTAYIEHEEHIRQSISEHLEKGKSLKDWKRLFLLEPKLKPTRDSVISLKIYSLTTDSGWIIPNYPHVDEYKCMKNRSIVSKILGDGDYCEYREDGWNNKQLIPIFSDKNRLANVYKHLVDISYVMREDDVQHVLLMMALERILSDNPNALCSVYAFAGPWNGVDAYRGLSYTIPPKIKNLFQGANAPTNYPGMREIKSYEHVTIQIHRYNLKNYEEEVVYKDVPIVAVHVPLNLRKKAYFEDSSSAED